MINVVCNCPRWSVYNAMLFAIFPILLMMMLSIGHDVFLVCVGGRRLGLSSLSCHKLMHLLCLQLRHLFASESIFFASVARHWLGLVVIPIGSKYLRACPHARFMRFSGTWQSLSHICFYANHISDQLICPAAHRLEWHAFVSNQLFIIGILHSYGGISLVSVI